MDYRADSEYDGAYMPILLDIGWKSNKLPRANHFGYYEGFHFVKKTIDEFVANGSSNGFGGISVSVHAAYDGRAIMKKEYVMSNYTLTL